MPVIKDLINSLRAMELPKGAESLLSSIGTEADTLETDRNDLKGKVATRQDENAALKQRAQDAEAERDDLKTKVPGDGTRVLSKADAERLDAYTALGKPDELKTKLETGVQAARAVKTQAMKDAVRKLGLEDGVLELRPFEDVDDLTVEGEGDTLKGTVKTAEGDKPFADWVKDKGLETAVSRFAMDSQIPGVLVLEQVGNRKPSTRDAGAEHRKKRHGFVKRG